MKKYIFPRLSFLKKVFSEGKRGSKMGPEAKEAIRGDQG